MSKHELYTHAWEVEMEAGLLKNGFKHTGKIRTKGINVEIYETDSLKVVIGKDEITGLIIHNVITK